MREVMANIVLLFVWLITGMSLRLSRRFSGSVSRVVKAFVVNVALPIPFARFASQATACAIAALPRKGHPYFRTMTHAGQNIWLAVIAIAAFTGPSVADDALGAPAPAGVALVLGNAAYTLVPALPACAASAHLVADRLKAAGFLVAERLDATNGGMQAALTAFDQAVAIHPGSAAVVYFCGYAVNYQDRDFVLPISPALSRPSDALTEGISGRVLGTVATGSSNTGPALVLLDLFGLPNDAAAAPTAALTPERADGRLAIAVALEAPGSDVATPVATALGTVLNHRDVRLPGLIGHLRSLMPSGGPSFIDQQEATADMWLIGGPPKPPASAPPPGGAAAAPEPEPEPEPEPLRAAAISTPPAPREPAGTQAAPLTPPEPSPPPTTPLAATPYVPLVPSRPPLPDETNMTDTDRRDVQIALARLGYYDGRIDGLLGPEARGAIRRWQREVGADETGTLSGAQATRLVDQEVQVTTRGGNAPARINRHILQTQVVAPPPRQTRIVIPPPRPRPWWHFW